MTYSDQSGFFTFFGAGNPEVSVKVLDGHAINGKWWVFHGALTSLQYTVTVTDKNTGIVKTYQHPASSGSSLCGGSDTGAFNLQSGMKAQGVIEFDANRPPRKSVDAAMTACVPSATRLCLLGGRFQVDLSKGGTAQQAVPLSDPAGMFWFLSSANVEVPIKVLDGRSINGKFWVFFGSMTDQSYQVTVTDTTTGVVKTYTPPGTFCGIADTSAF
jgi:hypothetical protein